MGPIRVVAYSPAFDDSARIGKVQEPVLVEALVAQPAIEGLDIGVIDGFTWPE